jgi:hypothetical protein
MLRRLVVLAALVLPSSALAAYPTPYAQQGNPGVLSTDGAVRFVAYDAPGATTTLAAVSASDGSRLRSSTLPGSFGVPMLTYNGVAGGLSHDGKTLVLQSVGLPPKKRFTIVGTDDLAARDTIALSGLFGYDALSPDAKTLYLIQRKSSTDYDHYVVRAYDLALHTLLPGRIADRTQKTWVMQGRATARATTADGRWVYTLYQNPGGYPFVHALDTVKGIAHCIGLQWPATDVNQFALNDMRLSIQGRLLKVGDYATIDRMTWKVKKLQ